MRKKATKELPNFKEFCQRARGRLNMNIKQFSELMGVSRQTIYAYERGDIQFPQARPLKRFKEIIENEKLYALKKSKSGNHYKRIRLEKNLSVKQLADLFNMKPVTIYKYENNMYKLKPKGMVAEKYEQLRKS
jgi:transcriptional regulator with XRE-family HTH domain